MSGFYLVQRMSREARPYTSPFDGRFALEYMGSSEFEWGAIPKALKEIRAVKDIALEARDVTRAGVTRTVYFVGSAKNMTEKVTAFVKWLADERPRGKESTYFPEQFDGEADEYQQRVNAWWSIEDDLMWALDLSVAADLLAAVKGVPLTESVSA